MRGFGIVPKNYLLRLLEEDMPYGDITSLIVPSDMDARATISVKEKCIVAGLEEASILAEHFGIAFRRLAEDGEEVSAGTRIAELEGNARTLLGIERTVLNLIGRMSGIATVTRRLVKLVKRENPRVRVAGTRKSLLKPIDKKAILVGGGDPHRFCLSDAILIKDNHLKLVPLREAVKKAKALSLYKPVEVEVESLEEAIEAAKAGADIILLDNMNPKEVAEVVSALKGENLREKVKIEVSGGINESNIREYARLDIDAISVGALTHSCKSVDVTMEVVSVSLGRPPERGL